MSQTRISEIQGSCSPAMVFTNGAGQVVFANRNFTRLNNAAASKISADLHLHEILPISVSSANQLIDSIKKGGDGYVARWQVLMPIEGSAPWDSTCNAVPVFDLTGNVIGIDMVLKDTARPDSEMSFSPKTHSDMVQIYVKDVFNQSKHDQSATFTQSYLSAQLEVLQIMLARVSGPYTRLAFEQVLTRIVKDHLIPCTIQRGFLNFTEKNIDIQKYSLMLKSSIGYAIDVVGKQFVKQEMLIVDHSIEPGLLQLVSQLDLGAIFSK